MVKMYSSSRPFLRLAIASAACACILLSVSACRRKGGDGRPKGPPNTVATAQRGEPDAATAPAAPAAQSAKALARPSASPAAQPTAQGGDAQAQGNGTAAPLAMRVTAGQGRAVDGDGAAQSAGSQTIKPSAVPVLLAAEHAYGLAAPETPIIPEDLRLGPLQDYRDKSQDANAACIAARAFLDGILAGKLAESSIAPDRISLLEVLAAPLLERPPAVAYRLGGISMTGGPESLTALARVAFAWQAKAGKAGGAIGADTKAGGAVYDFSKEGELGLRLEGGKWYVESISLDVDKGGAQKKADAPPARR